MRQMIMTKASEPEKGSKLVYVVLLLFFGVFGLHKFYIGKWAVGFAYLVTLGVLGILPLIDLVFFIFKEREQVD